MLSNVSRLCATQFCLAHFKVGGGGGGAGGEGGPSKRQGILVKSTVGQAVVLNLGLSRVPPRDIPKIPGIDTGR